MASPTPRSLVDLPTEILMEIVWQIPTIEDAYHLARSCSRLYEILQSAACRSRVFRSLAGVPGSSEYNLDKAFSVLVRMAPFKWCLKGTEKRTWILIDIDYMPIKDKVHLTMWDLTTIRNHQRHLTFHEALHKFLQQFYDLKRLWHNHFESGTEDILAAAAALQADILREPDNASTGVPADDLCSERTVIALTLDCLAVIRDLCHIECHATNRPQNWLFRHGSRVNLFAAGYEYNTVYPSVTLYRYVGTGRPKRARPAGRATQDEAGRWNYGHIEDMLGDILRLSLGLLNTQDPRHWSTVLYVLSVLVLIRDSLRPYLQWMRKMTVAGDAVAKVLDDLARYYYLCTDGGFVLGYWWDEEAYARRVGHCKVSIERAHRLRRLWAPKDDSDDEEDGVVKWDDCERALGTTGFRERLELFIRMWD
ncbi:uncharacterized protein BJX67DRAFT_367894 [Aspergillus lucknowensis]|uniref:F-box domain-containing protein n=1 Tax=Aspergillus lucknowensis TaxID=176173 RepID=A0ABR4L8I1_9EURO